MVLLFAAPYALGYLAVELGAGTGSRAWRLASPLVAAQAAADGASPPLACLLSLVAWPVWAVAASDVSSRRAP